MFALRLFYQRKRKLIIRSSAVLAVCLTALAAIMPAPQAYVAPDDLIVTPGLRASVKQATWTSDAIADLITSERLDSAGFVRLSFSPAAGSI